MTTTTEIHRKLTSDDRSNITTSFKKEGRSLEMMVGSYYKPKHRELHPLGDDAHFVCESKQMIGVADGVGGWINQGIDPGEYSRELMRNSLLALLEEPDHDVDPTRVLYEAYLNTYAEGSSTACLITLKDNYVDNDGSSKWLDISSETDRSRVRIMIEDVVNIGDSGFIIVRKGAKTYKSPVQQHSFNHPYQLGNGNHADCPNSAQAYKVLVKSGDVIIAGTDGLFDNMYPSEIEAVIKSTIDEWVEPEDVALAIGQVAYKYSMDDDRLTPFAKASIRAGKSPR